MFNGHKSGALIHAARLAFLATTIPWFGSSLAQGAGRPEAAVILGDSYASGEGGRWKGNSEAAIGSGNRSGTDTAAYWTGNKWAYDPGGLAYDELSYQRGINRSLHSPITYLKATGGLPAIYPHVFNLAASGARTEHVLPYAAGGVPYHSYQPQIEQMQQVADVYDIKLVVIGIGGNDMDFGGAVRQCMIAWAMTHHLSVARSCIDNIRDTNIPKLLDVYFKVGRVIDETKALMAARGQSDYKILLLGVPSIIPEVNAPGWKYSEGSRGGRGCPIRDKDSTYVYHVLVRKLNATLRGVAHRKGVDFLDTEFALHGHRLCEIDTVRSATGAGVPEGEAEWMRRLDITVDSWADLDEVLGVIFNEDVWNYPGDQGTIQESFHPNLYGQKALGYCLRAYANDPGASPKALECQNKSWSGQAQLASDVYVVPARKMATVSDTADRLIPDNGQWMTVSKAVTFATPYPGPTRKVMSVTIDIDHPRKGHLDIDVIDPNGKVYVFREPNPDDGGAWKSEGKAYTFYQTGSHTAAPLYENDFEAGTYQLRIRDTISGYTGVLRNWRIDFF